MSKHYFRATAIGGYILLFVMAIVLNSCKTPAPVVGDHIGNIAPEISAPDAQGKTQSLSALQGKLVLVEFWDSNNSASRKNHFEMQRMYSKYRNTSLDGGNGFAIYSISIDTDPKKWQEAIAADGINFTTMVNDTQAWNSKAVLDYNIASLPKYFLIDDKGIIINHNILIPELEKILIEQAN
ncbi:MAG TPA: TlpA disulfide reductase family protein [Chitinophagales bacterium]|nr:TlpA family protein disulfide reductase [Chitinophagales bacterium]HMU70907.1 TlpA disulfide reductase family protein [Chitinophagales bacterium]HMX05523.1 TlpA disulfide reductase family protein [Chitinophagales bacterium]HMZ89913.1 TlpA disulfide reductase family protein [Chitinophagales bacterium]HNA59104.1 TlpA disulfide reductase family protein [Chitinophagales bacterium]